jgi:hypothetical protein
MTSEQSRALGRTAGWALGLGLLCGYAAVFVIPMAMRLGVSEAAAQRLPIAAALGGVVLGVAVNVAATVRQLVQALLGVIVLGTAFWFLGVLAGGLLLGAGVPEHIADWTPVAGFVLGATLGLLPLYGVALDIIGRKKRAGRSIPR